MFAKYSNGSVKGSFVVWKIAVQCIVIGRIPQAWDGDVTPLTVLWCRVPTWRDKNNKTHYKRGICCIQWGHNYCYELFCLFTCRVHINITMSVFVIGETTDNKNYSTLLKSHVWIANSLNMNTYLQVNTTTKIKAPPSFIAYTFGRCYANLPTET